MQGCTTTKRQGITRKKGEKDGNDMGKLFRNTQRKKI